MLSQTGPVTSAEWGIVGSIHFGYIAFLKPGYIKLARIIEKVLIKVFKGVGNKHCVTFPYYILS